MRRTAIFVLVLGAFALGFAGASAIQEGGMDKGKHEGGDDEMVHPPALEDAHLDRMIGTWEWTGKMWMGGEEMPMVSKETIEWVLGHQFQLSRYESLAPDGTVVFEGLGMTRSNPEKNEQTTWWFDVHGVPQEYEGTRDGDTVTSVWEGAEGKARSIVTVREDGTAHAKMDSMSPGQTEWQPFFDVEGKKK